MRVINVEVAGYHVRKDAKVAGAMGEGNAANLRITFGEDWALFAKSVTFFNALGEKPTVRTLTTDLLEDAAKSTDVYLCPIPPEAMTDAGMLTFVIDGYREGVRQRSVEDTLEVKYSRSAEGAMESADPTPSQTEQLQGQIDAIIGDIQTARASAVAAVAAAESAGNSATSAAESAESAESAEEDAKTQAGFAEAAADEATAAMRSAEASATSAAASEANAAVSAQSVKADADRAEAARDSIVLDEEKMAQAVESADASASAAAASKTAAAASAQSVGNAAATASAAATKATIEADRAKAEADRAAGAAGGDFATRVEAQAMADEAEDNANAYTDKKIAAIPTPDVSVQITEHNTDGEAHSDIRELADSKVSKGGDTMTGALEFKPSDSEGYGRLYKNANSTGDYGLQLLDADADGNFMGFALSASLQKLELKKKRAGATSYTYPKIYSSDDPPEPSEVNAVPIWGGTMTGALTLSGDPYEEKHAATKQYVDAVEIKADAAQTAANNAASAASAAQTAANSKAPMYDYGTTDLTAGSSALESGKLYFVYE